MSDVRFIDRIHGGLGFLLFSAMSSVGGGVLIGLVIQSIGEPAGYIDANATLKLMVGSGLAIMVVWLGSLFRYPLRLFAYGVVVIGYASWLATLRGSFDVRAAALGTGVAFVVVLGLFVNLWMLRAVLGPQNERSLSDEDKRHAARRHLAIVTAFAVVIAVGTTYALVGK